MFFFFVQNYPTMLNISNSNFNILIQVNFDPMIFVQEWGIRINNTLSWKSNCLLGQYNNRKEMRCNLLARKLSILSIASLEFEVSGWF